ncbi:MAG: HAMP domain-containing histidine kinase [Lachnospiraceae bacterium]|nr:HAMP domain-containing histidine kinase [Lachnospiraceae bacterium]
MSEVILAVGICMMLAACVIVILHKRSTERTLDRVEKMLGSAINGVFSEDSYDEGRLSKLESELSDFLRISSLSAQNIKNERDKIKSLISDISHQTKTPISNLLLYSELLEKGELSPESRDSVETIHAQAEKLRFLIDSLVKLSRLENGILALEPRMTPLGPILADVTAELTGKAQAKGLTLLAADTVAQAEIDGKWTREAIVNIVDNAIKYTREGQVLIDTVEYEMFVEVRIKDTGIGIPEEEYAKVFKRFYRGGDVKNEEGVGIGLYLAREIVAGEGGYITVSSVVGKGTTFSVFLPKKAGITDRL